MMYFKIKQQAELRRHNSSIDPISQLNQSLCIFTTVVAVFYICYLPNAIQYQVEVYVIYFKIPINWDLFMTVYAFTNFLFFSNSCLNPIIYSRVHLKIYSCIKQVIRAFREKYQVEFNFCKRETAISKSTNRKDRASQKLLGKLLQTEKG